MKSFEIIKIISIILGGGGIVALFSFIYHEFFKNKAALENIKELLKNNEPIKTYHNKIRELLDKIAQIFGKPLSFKSFDRILLIALVYPILFFIVCYLVSGNNLIGTLAIFPEHLSIILRAFHVCLSAIYFIFLVLLFKNFDNIQDYILKKFNIKNKFLREFIFYIVFFVVLIVAFYVININVVVVVGMIGIVVGVGIGIGIGIGIAGGTGLLILVLGGDSNSVIVILLFFLFILPIANTIFDFISFEMSRFLTRKSLDLNSKIKISGILLLDFVIAVILLVGTAFLIPIFIELFNLYVIPLLKGAENIDWREMAILAKDYPFTKGISVTLMLFSTLFWTAIHAVIAFISLVLAPIGPKYIFKYLDKEKLTNIEFFFGALWLSMNIIISFLCIFVIPYCFISFFLKVPIAEILYNFVINHHFL
ncbi:MAG: hypothetical protein B6I26_03165 [Desulfobacteraceae bacterium 4572_130]|nr:MAG: hypothetical protein B6I26_03165 [Desulfobacteraceae bacterium 4572_130]